MDTGPLWMEASHWTPTMTGLLSAQACQAHCRSSDATGQIQQPDEGEVVKEGDMQLQARSFSTLDPFLMHLQCGLFGLLHFLLGFAGELSWEQQSEHVVHEPQLCTQKGIGLNSRQSFRPQTTARGLPRSLLEFFYHHPDHFRRPAAEDPCASLDRLNSKGSI
jgi:hypothetical protein